MIAKSIIKSDQFLDMPATTQCLYFHLLLEADDDGFINAPKSIMRVIGAKDDDMRVLQAKGYIIPFESGVIVIKHWRLHNSLRKDRYNPNPQLENERKQLVVADNKEYQLATNWQPNGNQLATNGIPLVATGKDRLGKDRLEIYCHVSHDDETQKPHVEIIEYLNLKTGSKFKPSTKPYVQAIQARLKEGYSIDDFKTVINKKCAEWIGTKMEKYLTPKTLFAPSHFDQYLNANVKPEMNDTERRVVEINALIDAAERGTYESGNIEGDCTSRGDISKF